MGRKLKESLVKEGIKGDKIVIYKDIKEDSKEGY